MKFLSKTSLASAIFISGFFYLIVITYSCDNSSASLINYEQTKLSLEDQEKGNPINFLSTDGTYHETLFGDKMVLNGTISNNATIATYKDVVLQVHFYSKTKTEIGSENYVVYDYFPPKQIKNFKSKIKAPIGTNSISWNIVSTGVQ